ncbi:MAG: sulfatase-like hydrolase/transferase, partial [Sedimentisphaerales bacterium]|nr:sulfatase-like hydrolase/transferase [Sedimentisphaerales bacterium]
TKTKTKTKTKAQGVVRQLVLDDQPFTPPKQGFYLTEAITNHAIRMLDEYGRDQRPFFQYIAYNAPHWPLHALPEDIAKYQGKFLRGWDALRSERYARLKRMNIIKENWPLSPRDDDVAAWDKVEDKDQMDLKMAVYAAQIDRVDQGIGRILATLRRIGQEDNTLILFLSDNGGCHEGGPWGFDNRKNGLPPGDVDSFMSYGRSWANLSNTPFRLFKHWVHEGGIATPLIVSWPGQIATAGAVTHQVGHVIDIMATCCDAAGIEYPATFQGQAITPLEGRSLVPVFQDKQRSGHDVLYWEHLGNRACRQGKWKLVSRGNNRWELYDLEADRTELNDLSGEQPEKARELTELYAAWARRCGVK